MTEAIPPLQPPIPSVAVATPAADAALAPQADAATLFEALFAAASAAARPVPRAFASDREGGIETESAAFLDGPESIRFDLIQFWDPRPLPQTPAPADEQWPVPGSGAWSMRLASDLYQRASLVDVGVDRGATNPLELETTPGSSLAVTANFDLAGVQPSRVDSVNAVAGQSVYGSMAMAGAGNTDLSATRTSAAQTSVQVPIDRPEFAEALAGRVLWQVEQRVQTAQLNLNPPELGPVEVKVELQRGDAQVHFHAAHGQVRDALESALPRLREMFAEVGLNLADASVSSNPFGNGRDTMARPEPPTSWRRAPDVEIDDDAPRTRSVGIGLIDYYV